MFRSFFLGQNDVMSMSIKFKFSKNESTIWMLFFIVRVVHEKNSLYCFKVYSLDNQL